VALQAAVQAGAGERRDGRLEGVEGWKQCFIGANLTTGEVPSLGEVASSAARSFVQTVGEQGARVAQDREGQHAADGSEKCIAEHMDDAPE
jgi:hypothetical protein